MSKSQQIVGVALFLGAMGFAVRAAAAYSKSDGQVWLDYEPPAAPPAKKPIDFSWLENLFGGGFSQVPPSPPPVQSGGGGYVPPSPPPAASNVSGDVLTLARTIYGEAAQESQIGKEAIANVVMNRVRSRRWPNTVTAVCRQPWQFSAWNANDPMRARIEKLWPGSNSTFNTCIAIAERAVRYQLPDQTNGATHYYATYIPEPSWVRNSPDRVMTRQIGVHKFYKGIA